MDRHVSDALLVKILIVSLYEERTEGGRLNFRVWLYHMYHTLIRNDRSRRFLQITNPQNIRGSLGQQAYNEERRMLRAEWENLSPRAWTLPIRLRTTPLAIVSYAPRLVTLHTDRRNNDSPQQPIYAPLNENTMIRPWELVDPVPIPFIYRDREGDELPPQPSYILWPQIRDLVFNLSADIFDQKLCMVWICECYENILEHPESHALFHISNRNNIVLQLRDHHRGIQRRVRLVERVSLQDGEVPQWVWDTMARTRNPSTSQPFNHHRRRPIAAAAAPDAAEATDAPNYNRDEMLWVPRVDQPNAPRPRHPAVLMVSTLPGTGHRPPPGRGQPQPLPRPPLTRVPRPPRLLQWRHNSSLMGSSRLQVSARSQQPSGASTPRAPAARQTARRSRARRLTESRESREETARASRASSSDSADSAVSDTSMVSTSRASGAMEAAAAAARAREAAAVAARAREEAVVRMIDAAAEEAAERSVAERDAAITAGAAISVAQREAAARATAFKILAGEPTARDRDFRIMTMKMAAERRAATREAATREEAAREEAEIEMAPREREVLCPSGAMGAAAAAAIAVATREAAARQAADREAEVRDMYAEALTNSNPRLPVNNTPAPRQRSPSSPRSPPQ